MKLKSFKQFFLMEAIDYKSMFNIVMKSEYGTRYQEMIDNEIGWATDILQKNYRIQWWLKWVRLSMLLNIFEDVKINKKEHNPKIQKVIDDFDIIDPSGGYSEKRFDTINLIRARLSMYHNSLKHYYDLHIEAINDYTYDNNTSIKQLLAYFSEIEKKWAEERKGTIPYLSQPIDSTPDVIDPDDKNDYVYEVMKFDDDYYWVDLNTNRCEKESDAMGHCGTASDRDSTLYSLRYLNKKTNDQKTWMWEPHVTFELTDKHDLTQMKGKNNDKPSSKYHKYIIALLLHKVEVSTDGTTGYLVKEVVGGGYRPETNFSLSDLTESEQDAVFKQRPELMSIKEQYKKLGFTEELKVRISETCDKLGIGNVRKWDEDGTGFTIEQFAHIEAFVSEWGNDHTKNTMGYISGEEYIDYELSDSDIEDFFHDEFDEEKVKEYLIEHESEFDPDEDDVYDFLSDNQLDIYEQLRYAVERGYESGTNNQMIYYMKKAIDNIDVVVDGDEIATCHGSAIFSEPFFITIDRDSLIKILSDGIDFEEHSLGYSIACSEPYNGFIEYSSQAAEDYIKQETDYKDLLK